MGKAALVIRQELVSPPSSDQYTIHNYCTSIECDFGKSYIHYLIPDTTYGFKLTSESTYELSYKLELYDNNNDLQQQKTGTLGLNSTINVTNTSPGYSTMNTSWYELITINTLYKGHLIKTDTIKENYKGIDNTYSIHSRDLTLDSSFDGDTYFNNAYIDTGIYIGMRAEIDDSPSGVYYCESSIQRPFTVHEGSHTFYVEIINIYGDVTTKTVSFNVSYT